jgi:hypothetical protein
VGKSWIAFRHVLPDPELLKALVLEGRRELVAEDADLARDKSNAPTSLRAHP